jgi:hypothetical protein
MAYFNKEQKKYMKNTDYFNPSDLEEGDEVKIRILSAPILGWEAWDSANKPIRFYHDKKPRSIPNAVKPAREFGANIVWNYDLGLLQVWVFRQQGVHKSLDSLDDNKGSVLNYDIFISKHGTGTETRYILRPASPHKAAKEIIEIYEDTPVNLHALYVNKEPFIDLEAGKREESNDASVA